MTSAEPITVFVCGPHLLGENLSNVVARQGALVWENGSEPAPQPVEQIRAVQHVRLEGVDRLIVLVTDAGLYLTTADALTQDSTNHADSRRAVDAWNE